MALKLDNPKEAVVDPHNHKRRYKNWRAKSLGHLFESDVELIQQYVTDMEEGINTAKVKKGARSYSRLNALRSRIPLFAAWVRKVYNKRMVEITSDELIRLANMLKKGEIKKGNGEAYQSYDDYLKDFKAFWHWYMKFMRKENKKTIEDITVDLDDSGDEKPKFVYLTEAQIKMLIDNAKFDYKVIMQLLFDSGMRAPSEFMNIRVKDIAETTNPKIAYCNIRDEVSKTFGRKFKLMFSYPMLKQYIERNKLKADDFIFTKNPIVINRYLKRLAFRVLGIGKMGFRNGGKDKTFPDVKGGLTMYDFRHCSACYWLPRYRSESALKYRFGWRTNKMIEYYTQFLGMKDTIQEDDMLIDENRTQLEKQLEQQQRQNELLQEQFVDMQKQMEKMLARQTNIEQVTRVIKKKK